MDNNIYNLILQLTQEQKALWRITKNYLKDAGKNIEVKKFWNELAKDKEKHIIDLKNLIKKNLK